MLPQTMRAITLDGFGGPEVLTASEIPLPVVKDHEVLIQIAAVGFNRADVSQREGSYPPPPGESELLGLECSGIIMAVGSGVTRYREGDKVCALLAGGGYAEYVAVREEQVLPVPGTTSLIDAAGLPEVACTVFSNFALGAMPGPNRAVLIHGGSGGLGTFALGFAQFLGARVFATAGSKRGIEHCVNHGAEEAWNYREQDFVTEVARVTDHRGVDLILDPVGGNYLDRNLDSLAIEGRLAIVATLEGASGTLDIRKLMKKRLTIQATTLRARPVTGPGSKASIVRAVEQHIWPIINTGRLQVAHVFRMRLEDARDLHSAHQNNELPPGKAVLVVNDRLV